MGSYCYVQDCKLRCSHSQQLNDVLANITVYKINKGAHHVRQNAAITVNPACVHVSYILVQYHLRLFIHQLRKDHHEQLRGNRFNHFNSGYFCHHQNCPEFSRFRCQNSMGTGCSAIPGIRLNRLVPCRPRRQKCLEGNDDASDVLNGRVCQHHGIRRCSTAASENDGT